MDDAGRSAGPMAGRKTLPDTPTSYEDLRARFRWAVPDELNMGVACSDAIDPRAVALVLRDGGARRVVTFGETARMSNRLANGLAELGVGTGDRVAVIVPQSLETAVSHLAVWKLGGVSVPLSALFGPDALSFRIGDSDARVVIAAPEILAAVVEAVDGLDVEIVVTGADASGHRSFDEMIEGANDVFEPVLTSADDPAFLIYTSGTTGPPKGALHAHRSLIGHLPSFELYYERTPRPGDVHWTPADWAWIGGLMDSLMPAWFFGLTVVTTTSDFDPEGAIRLIEEEGVTCTFLPPTALKMMRSASVRLDDGPLRAVFTGGEALGDEMLRWGEDALGAAINEGYGQTEANLVVGNCTSIWPVRPGSMGRPMPGHEVVVLDDRREPVVGATGEIAVKTPDPVVMKEYWGRPDATRDKFHGPWLLTGDLGVEDEDGYLWFVSRADDVINSRGYRIGPGEIEESLMGHPAVAMAGAVGVDDSLRGQVPVAFVALRPGWEASVELEDELRSHVRHRLAAHEVPARVHFVDEFPRTTTGKMMRRALRDLLPE